MRYASAEPVQQPDSAHPVHRPLGHLPTGGCEDLRGAADRHATCGEQGRRATELRGLPTRPPEGCQIGRDVIVLRTGLQVDVMSLFIVFK